MPLYAVTIAYHPAIVSLYITIDTDVKGHRYRLRKLTLNTLGKIRFPRV